MGITRPEDIIPKKLPIILFPHSHFFTHYSFTFSDYSHIFTYYSLQVLNLMHKKQITQTIPHNIEGYGARRGLRNYDDVLASVHSASGIGSACPAI